MSKMSLYQFDKECQTRKCLSFPWFILLVLSSLSASWSCAILKPCVWVMVKGRRVSVGRVRRGRVRGKRVRRRQVRIRRVIGGRVSGRRVIRRQVRGRRVRGRQVKHTQAHTHAHTHTHTHKNTHKHTLITIEMSPLWN